MTVKPNWASAIAFRPNPHPASRIGHSRENPFARRSSDREGAWTRLSSIWSCTPSFTTSAPANAYPRQRFQGVAIASERSWPFLPDSYSISGRSRRCRGSYRAWFVSHRIEIAVAGLSMTMATATGTLAALPSVLHEEAEHSASTASVASSSATRANGVRTPH
jgi:hypothetical protein